MMTLFLLPPLFGVVGLGLGELQTWHVVVFFTHTSFSRIFGPCSHLQCNILQEVLQDTNKTI